MKDNAPIAASTIRPGILVVLKSTIVGGIAYRRVDLDVAADDIDADPDAEVARWETTKIIDDPDEYERATRTRNAATGRVRRACAHTSFGLICPTEYEGALDAAIRDARATVDAFNVDAKHTRVGIYVLKGRIASDDAEAARAITQEIAGLVRRMDQGIASLDPDAIRDAARRAREIGGMLSEDNRTKIDGAIAEARSAARTIVKRIERDGEDKATVLAEIQRGQIDSARIAFLDMSESMTGDALPSVEAQRFFEMMADPAVDVAKVTRTDDDDEEDEEEKVEKPRRRAKVGK